MNPKELIQSLERARLIMLENPAALHEAVETARFHNRPLVVGNAIHARVAQMGCTNFSSDLIKIQTLDATNPGERCHVLYSGVVADLLERAIAHITFLEKEKQ